MPVRSVYLVAECQRRGLLSKEAGDEVLAKREKIIKAAMRKQAAELVGSIMRAQVVKQASIAKEAGRLGDAYDALTGARNAAKGGKGAAEAMGFAESFKRGGMGQGGGWGDVTANLTKFLGLAGLTAGATAGIQGILRNSRDKEMNKQIEASYVAMFDEHPKLKEIQEAQPGKVEKHFGVLARYAPSMAADPTVAGEWVKATALQGQVDPAAVKNLAETQRRIDEVNEGRNGIRGLAPIKATDIAKASLLGH